LASIGLLTVVTRLTMYPMTLFQVKNIYRYQAVKQKEQSKDKTKT